MRRCHVSLGAFRFLAPDPFMFRHSSSLGQIRLIVVVDSVKGFEFSSEGHFTIHTFWIMCDWTSIQQISRLSFVGKIEREKMKKEAYVSNLTSGLCSPLAPFDQLPIRQQNFMNSMGPSLAARIALRFLCILTPFPSLHLFNFHLVFQRILLFLHPSPSECVDDHFWRGLIGNQSLWACCLLLSKHE